MAPLWKLALTLGTVLLAIGAVAFVVDRFGLKKLPGDIVFKSGNTTFAFPIVTCIVLSVVLTLVFRLFR